MAPQPTPNARATYRSYGRTWQLWSDGTGQRTIEYWDRDGNHKTVGYLKTRRRTEARRLTYGMKYQTVVTWQVYQTRWTDASPEYKSDIAAFKAYTRGL